MKNIDDLLSGGEPEDKKTVEEENVLSELLITEYTFEKAYAYAKLVDELFDPKDGIECGGYLLTPKNANDRVARDACLAKGQEVSGGEYLVNGQNVINTGKELERKGQKVLGWWHSHGHMSTFFSYTDDRGQLTVLNGIAPFNYIAKQKDALVRNLEVLEKSGNKLVLHDPTYPTRKYEIEVKGDGKENKLIAIPQFKVTEQKRIGFAYGLVVNDKNEERKPYAEIATREYCFCCKYFYDESKQVPVALIDGQKLEFDEDEMRKEIKQRVKRKETKKLFGFIPYSGGSYSEYGSGSSYGSYGGSFGGSGQGYFPSPDKKDSGKSGKDESFFGGNLPDFID